MFPEFSTQSLKGQTVTNAVFAGKKLTMVNVWATWCPPCVGEMPALGSLGRSMPEGTQLIGILFDEGNAQKALTIIEQAGADFLQICYCEDMASFKKTIKAIPTTVFVDSKGQIAGKPVVGARSEQQYRAEIQNIIDTIDNA